MKLAFHIHKASASIDVRKQLDGFETQESFRHRREKYKNGQIWGGSAVGSVGYKTSPKAYKIQENMKLPPLNCNPVFQDVASNTTMSNIEIPMSKERPPKVNVFSQKKSNSRPDLM